MKLHRGRMRILAVAMVLALMITLMTPFTKEADAGYTYIPFLATGGGFTCLIYVINFFPTSVSMTIDAAIATMLTETTSTFTLTGFQGKSFDCTGLLGVGAGTGVNFLSVFLYQSASLPPQAFGVMWLPSTLGGDALVPPLLFQWT